MSVFNDMVIKIRKSGRPIKESKNTIKPTKTATKSTAKTEKSVKKAGVSNADGRADK